MKNYNETELQELLAAVESDIVSLVKGEQEKLSKAHPGEETSSEVPPDESATAPAAAESAPAEGSAPPADSAPVDAPPSAPAGDESAPPADASAPVDGDPAADQSADPAALEAEYAKLPPEDLKAHYMACKSALFALMGGAGPDAGAAPGPDASAPPAPAAAPPAPPEESPSAPPALKSEIKSDVKANGENPLHKSEEVVSLEAELAKSNESLAALASIVKTLMKPTRKAVTSVAHLAKSADETPVAGDVSGLSAQEVKARLKRAIENPRLAKNDRDLIYGFDVGQVKVEQIAHLLK